MSDYNFESDSPEFDCSELQIKIIHSLQPYIRDGELIDQVNMLVIINALTNVLAIFSNMFGADTGSVISSYLSHYNNIKESRENDEADE